MEASRRKFTREPASQRREDLIRATLSLIGKSGVRAATVRGIAQEAGVTLGLIRHYFSSKDDLIYAAYEFHMSEMTRLTMAASDESETTAAERLAGVVRASLELSVSNAEAVALWASFLNRVQQDDRIREVHRRTYYEFRDRLEVLIADVLHEAGKTPKPGELRQLAIASNAVIDGLWMEGGALPADFEPGELEAVGLRSVGAIIGIELD